MWPFRKKSPKECKINVWRRNGYPENEIKTLLRLFQLNQAKTIEYDYWDNRRYSRFCPYCNGAVTEVGFCNRKERVGSARDVGVLYTVEVGFFCLICGAESVCGEVGCRFRIGEIWPNNQNHWNATGGKHRALKIKKGKRARNLFDLLDELEGAMPATEESQPDLQDEYAKLEARLEEIVAEKLELEEEIIRIHERQREINIVFEQEAFELAEPPRELMAAADDDPEIVAAAEAEAEALTTADK